MHHYFSRKVFLPLLLYKKLEIYYTFDLRDKYIMLNVKKKNGYLYLITHLYRISVISINFINVCLSLFVVFHCSLYTLNILYVFHIRQYIACPATELTRYLSIRFSESQPQDTLHEEALGTLKGVFSFSSCLISSANDFFICIFFVFTNYVCVRWKALWNKCGFIE